MAEIFQRNWKGVTISFKFFKIHEPLPREYRLATVQEVNRHPEELYKAMPGSEIANLVDGSVVGAFYGGSTRWFTMNLKGCCSAQFKWCCSCQNLASLSCFWRSVFQNMHVCVLILLHMPDCYKYAACKFVTTWVTSWPWSRQNQTWPSDCSASTSSCLWTIAWQQFKKSKIIEMHCLKPCPAGR